MEPHYSYLLRSGDDLLCSGSLEMAPLLCRKKSFARIAAIAKLIDEISLAITMF